MRLAMRTSISGASSNRLRSCDSSSVCRRGSCFSPGQSVRLKSAACPRIRRFLPKQSFVAYPRLSETSTSDASGRCVIDNAAWRQAICRSAPGNLIDSRQPSDNKRKFFVFRRNFKQPHQLGSFVRLPIRALVVRVRPKVPRGNQMACQSLPGFLHPCRSFRARLGHPHPAAETNPTAPMPLVHCLPPVSPMKRDGCLPKITAAKNRQAGKCTRVALA